MAEQYPTLQDRPIKETICLFDVDGTLADSIGFFYEIALEIVDRDGAATGPATTRSAQDRHHQPEPREGTHHVELSKGRATASEQPNR